MVINARIFCSQLPRYYYLALITADMCVCVNYINTIMLLIMAHASMSCEWWFMFFRNTYFLPVFLLNSLDIMGPVLSYNLN